MIPSAYTLRHARGYGRSALRNWVFQVSKDGQNWTSLYTHVDDCSLNEPGLVEESLQIEKLSKELVYFYNCMPLELFFFCVCEILKQDFLFKNVT